MMTRDGIVRLGLVGCGEVTAFKHLAVLRHIPGITVEALADVDEGRLRYAADRYRIRNRFRDLESLLKHPGIDAVGVCVPAQAHWQNVLTALDAGKHVFVEKPLCLSLDEADQLGERAERTGMKVLVGHHMRWHRLIQNARKLIREGRLGTVESLRIIWNSPRIGRKNSEWRFRRDLGGGVLVEIAVHAFDLWRHLLDSEVEEIYAVSRNGRRDDESLAVTARMENGLIVSGLFSENAPHEIDVEIFGDSGRLRVDCLRFDGFEFFPAGSASGRPGQRISKLCHALGGSLRGATSLLRGGDYIGSYEAEWLHFAGVLRGNEPEGCTIEDGRRSLAVVLAAAQSADNGRPVRITEAPRRIVPVRR